MTDTYRAQQFHLARRQLLKAWPTIDAMTTYVLNALMPEISDPEELRKLLVQVGQAGTPAVVLDAQRRPWILFENDHGDWYAMRLGDQDEAPAVAVRLDFEDWDPDDWDPENGDPWIYQIPGPLTVVVKPA